MLREHIANIFKQAAMQKHLCELVDFKGHVRIVQPYGIFRSSRGQQELCCFQVSGFSESGKIPNWRNLKIEDIKGIKVLKEKFTKRIDFNASNKAVYPYWYFRI